MALDLDQVLRIAHLARIEITDDEAQRTLDQLSDIFAMIEKMRAVDTTGIEPMAHPLGGHQRLRADGVTESDRRAENLANAPEQQDGLILVPKVIE
jgi:aspartyl-tRNA(Asn)/glutamyl-tRNA(Gln) amidotransferase subunit C